MEPLDAGAARLAEGRDGTGNGTESEGRGRRDEGASALGAGGGPTGIVSFRRGGQLRTQAQTGAVPGRGTGKYRDARSPRLAAAVPVAPPPGQSGAPRRGEREAGSEGGGSGRSEEGGTRRACDRVAAEERTRCRRRRRSSSSSCSSSCCRRREKFHSRPSPGSPTQSGAGRAASGCNPQRAGRGERCEPEPASAPRRWAAAGAGGAGAEEGRL